MKVWQFTAATWSTGDQSWYAVSEEGLIASHISSSRGWGIIDTGPTGFYKDKYPADAEVIVLPEGEFPPEEFMLKAGFKPKEDSENEESHHA